MWPNRPSASSRMVAVTANIEDTNRASLKPGRLRRRHRPGRLERRAPVIPQTAIRPSERGFLAFVVENGKASERILILGMRTADGLSRGARGNRGRRERSSSGAPSAQPGPTSAWREMSPGTMTLPQRAPFPKIHRYRAGRWRRIVAVGATTL
jgi:membrane fusion protein, multidrug efflux system